MTLDLMGKLNYEAFFQQTSHSQRGRRGFPLGLKLKKFAADLNFGERNGIFVATDPGRWQIEMTMIDRNELDFVL